jgi:2-(1,2-epoxy-1,2-dihydrophenyl)acetyl-CoA isomerase
VDYTTLRFEVRDGVAHLTLDRPDAANALDIAMGRELLDAALRCEEDASIRAVLITGEGRFFCAGGDVRGFAAQGERVPIHIRQLTTYLHGALSRFARGDAPVIAAVNGSAAGAGFSLVCACDVALAAESASFTVAYTRIGFAPDGGSTFFLPRLVGLRRAMELMLTNRLLSAREAFDLGLVTRVVADDALLAEAAELARQLASGPTRAFGATKRLLLGGMHESLETQMELESRAISASAGSSDGKEGMQAFVEKRAPRFRGA